MTDSKSSKDNEKLSNRDYVTAYAIGVSISWAIGTISYYLGLIPF